MALVFRSFARTALMLSFVAMLNFGMQSGWADTLTLAHNYKAIGTNPDGSSYQGDVTIDILSTTTFGIKWSIGGDVYEGFGMRLNNSLAATYAINGQPGLVIYEVQGKGLNGLWSVKGRDGSGTERLVPVN